MIFGAIIGAGVIGILIAPLMSRLLRFFPPVVTGTIILVIGISLMRIGINWIFGTAGRPDRAEDRQSRACRLARSTVGGGLGGRGSAALRPGSTLAADDAEPRLRAGQQHHPVAGRARRRRRRSRASPRASSPTSRC